MFFYRRWLGLLLTLLVVILPGVTLAQEATMLTVTQVDTSNYPQVRLLIGAPGGGLPDPASLRVNEDGNEIPIDKTQAEEVRTGVAVIVLIDTSRSMRGAGLPDSADRLQDARDQTVALAQALNVDTDLLGIFAFHREVVPVLPLSRVDGGAVSNTMVTAEVLGSIPDKPGGANKKPTQEDLQNDDRAFSAVSAAVGRAIDELSNPQTSDAYILDNLPQMQKVIVLFADSCDDTLDAPGSKVCSVPVDVQTRLAEVVRTNTVSIFSVGVGTPDEQQASPKAPLRPDAGFLYAARFDLLQLYAQQTPNSHFFQLYTTDANQAQTIRDEFRRQVIEPVIVRGQHLSVTYSSLVSSAGRARRVTISSDRLRVNTEFEEPRVPPSVNITSKEVDERLVISPEIAYSQAPLARVDYFIDDSTVPIAGVGAGFELDLSQIEPGEHTIALEAIDQRGDRSPRSGAIKVEVPRGAAPPVGTDRPIVPARALTPTEQLNAFLLNNIISLITLLVVVVLAIVVLANPRGRAAAANVTSRVTGVITRVTRPIASAGPLAADTDYLLVVRHGGSVGLEYPLASLNTYLGADPSLVDLVLNDPHISGRHAAINREGNDLYVTDLGSTNGTYVNQAPLTPNMRMLLRPGDMLTIGGLTLECVYRGTPPAGGSAHQATVAYNPGQNGQSR